MEKWYSIKEAAERCSLTAHTLRYYDKEGLLPFVERSEGGARKFKESDFNWISMINCLKNSGLSIREIRRYMELCEKGDSSLPERLQLFEQQKNMVESQMKELQSTLKNLEYKVWYYTKAVANGTEGKRNPWECHNLEEEWLKEKAEKKNQ